MLNVERALIICAHPDDEVLGLGGTIKKMTNAGVEVTVLMFANGNEGYTSMEEIATIVETRRIEREVVQKMLNIHHYEAHSYEDYAIPANEITYKICIEAIRKYKPNIVFTHYWQEYNTHKAVASIATDAFWQAGWSCSLDLGEPWKPDALYYFEVIELLNHVSHMVDITDTFEAKMESMRAYASQCTVVSGALQQIEGKALMRGSQAGLKYGEAFLKSINRPEIIC
ncbi:diacetylchitobiose deacetylase [Paenibacillus baekrokdamisoli]|uniref:Diacetylchitobiose deacetylase n=1 Tax=Paenibacillus baekrokdamisoli TaxID=1712516 RepID=A0A3G9ILC4_9BACL|nr:PIG-L family deacetylase [Paenibacillus baekrokdamisoli]MBB3067081.1 LmbE family N-acetylglucosaminyl deacetylase [Paenibacillus baekrokdamisoli]BBH19727.1 diacetylchitobiose deacetylase [Paenibacillus baekrokdamisoli]